MDEKIKMNFPPNYVEGYVKKWLEKAKEKPETQQAELAMIQDIATMIGIAAKVMKPMKPIKPIPKNS